MKMRTIDLLQRIVSTEGDMKDTREQLRAHLAAMTENNDSDFIIW